MKPIFISKRTSNFPVIHWFYCFDRYKIFQCMVYCKVFEFKQFFHVIGKSTELVQSTLTSIAVHVIKNLWARIAYILSSSVWFTLRFVILHCRQIKSAFMCAYHVTLLYPQLCLMAMYDTLVGEKADCWEMALSVHVGLLCLSLVYAPIPDTLAVY